MARNGSLNLYLVRHAFAAHADPSRWPDDSKRPVTADGARRFAAAARGLRRLVPDVDVVLSSGFARAWETAEILRDVTGWPEPRECAALEAGKPAESGLEALRERDEASVALVGHEPYLSRLASLLCAGGEDVMNLELKKGAVAFVVVDGEPSPGNGLLRWSVRPKILRALDRGAG
ncbi:MAG TPA: histidine phosphatase family protein [Gaiellaceae bacterium]